MDTNNNFELEQMRAQLGILKQKLEKQGEKLQSAFVGDFVAEINETIRGAKEEIDKNNYEILELEPGFPT